MAQQYATDEAGNVWEVDAQGNPVRFVSPPQSNTVAPNAARAAAAALEAPQAAATLARTQQQINTTAATAPYDARRAAAEAAKAEADATKAQRDVEAAQATANPQQQKRMQSLADDEVLGALARARTGVNNGYSAGRWARLGQIPLLGAQIEPQGVVDLRGDLGTVASRVTLDTLAKLKQASPTGASGLGSLTEREGALLRDSVAALDQAQSPDKLLENLANVEKHYRNVRALMDGQDYRDPKVAERYGIAQAPEPQQAMTLAQGATRDEADPALRGVNARIRSMIGAGKSANDIVAYMNSVRPGLGTERAGDVLAATKFRAQNPKTPLSDYVISVENRSVPMSQARQVTNTLAQMPIGAYATSAANALTANNLSRAFDNPTVAKAGIDAIADENPVSAFLGTASGGALAGAGIEAALPLRGLAMAARFRQPAADAIYGGIASASDDGSALTGATEGVVGGMVGRLGTRALGQSLRGVRNADVQGLRAEGVTSMTPGSILGGRFKAREDRLAGFAGIGDDIKARQRQSFIDMNRAAFRQSVPPTTQNAIGGYAEDGVEQLRQEVGDAYGRALNGRSFDLTEPQLQQDLTGAIQQGMAIPRTGPEFGYAVRERVDPVMTAGRATGPQIQDVLQGLRDADFGTDAMGVAANNAAGRTRDAFTGMVNRQAPDVMPQLTAADQSYRRLNILADAVGRAVNTDGIFSPAQLGMAARTNAKRFNGPIGAATTERPFFDLQRMAQNVLPSKVPDSGTAGRQEAGSMLGRLKAGTRNLALSPLYSEGLTPAINSLLLDRTPAMIAAGQAVERRARLGGLFGAPLLVDYGPGS